MTLALIAGTGDLPPALLARLDVRPVVCALRGNTPQTAVDLTFRLEHLGSVLAMLRDRGVTDICMAGAIQRPQIDTDEIDEKTAPLVPQIMAALGAGDDGALRAVIAIFEAEGFGVRAAQDIAPDLLPAAGILSAAKPAPEVYADAALGERTVAAMGAADIGQACILRGGKVLAREDDRGTQAMLSRFGVLQPDVSRSGNPFTDIFDAATDMVASTADWLSGGQTVGAQGAILFKAPKPGQDRRADLPVIGPDTVVVAQKAKLSGIVIEAGGVLVLDLPSVLHICDSFGLFLWVRPRGGA